MAQNSCIRFNLKTGGHYQSIFVYLKDSSGNNIKSETNTTDDPNNWGYQTYDSSYALNAGTYYIELTTDGGNVTYSFSSYLNAAAGNNQVVAGLNNKYLGNAEEFTMGNRLAGVAADQNCYYRFTLSEMSNVRMNYEPDYSNYRGYVYFTLLDGSGEKRLSSIECMPTTYNAKSYVGKLPAGTYFLNVRTYGGKNPYIVETSATPVTVVRPSIPTDNTVVKPAAKLSKMKGVTATSPSRKRLRIKWKKMNCSGYQVQCSKNKTFTQIIKSRTIGKRYTSYTLSGLKRKSRYYVRVRAYKYVNARKIYSSWSAAKGVKIK